MTTGTTAPSVPNTLTAQDDSRQLQKIFTGHVVGQPAMGFAPLAAKVVSSSPSAVKVTITTFKGTGPTPTFTCYYQKLPRAIPRTPPAGAKCFVLFAGNDPLGYGVVVCFTTWPHTWTIPSVPWPG